MIVDIHVRTCTLYNTGYYSIVDLANESWAANGAMEYTIFVLYVCVCVCVCVCVRVRVCVHVCVRV